MEVNETSHYVRNQATAVTTSGRFLVIVGARRFSFEVSDTGSASELWESLATPVAGDELLRQLQHWPSDVTSLLAELLRFEVVAPLAMESANTATVGSAGQLEERPCRRLVLGVSGAVQSVFVANYVHRLLSSFTETLDVVLTESAQAFVTPRALTALGTTVWCDTWETNETTQVAHIHLANSADLVLVLPASAHTIFRLALGACSDLLSLVVTATTAPVAVAPSMNPSMWRSPALRRNVERLRQNGAFVIEPGLGFEIGNGKEAHPEIGAVGLADFAPSFVPTLRGLLRDEGARE